MGDLLANHGAKYYSHFVFCPHCVLFTPELVVKRFSGFKYLLVIFKCDLWLFKSFVNLCNLPKGFDTLLDPPPSGVVRLVVEWVPGFLSLLALITTRTIMPNQKVVVVQSLKTLEKVMAGFGAHLTYHVKEVNIAVHCENSV